MIQVHSSRGLRSDQTKVSVLGDLDVRIDILEVPLARLLQSMCPFVSGSSTLLTGVVLLKKHRVAVLGNVNDVFLVSTTTHLHVNFGRKKKLCTPDLGSLLLSNTIALMMKMPSGRGFLVPKAEPVEVIQNGSVFLPGLVDRLIVCEAEAAGLNRRHDLSCGVLADFHR